MSKELIVLESNQNHATITNNGVCPTLSASMGLGGGYVPMITEVEMAAGFNGYKSKSATIQYQEECAPCIEVSMPPAVLTMSKESHFTRANKDIANSLVATDYKDPPLVLVGE